MNSLLVLTSLIVSAPAVPQDDPRDVKDTFQASEGWKPLGEALWFDPESRQLHIRAKVVLREGFLEHLLCLTYTKEHESILATEANPRFIHAGLLLTGAEVGRPVVFQPEFKPPTGTPIVITLRWQEEGQRRSADARTWVKAAEGEKLLSDNWVFAGSLYIEDPQTGQKYYSADGGDLITVANFASAILDVPFASSADDAARGFVANTPRIPPIGTFVTMTLRPADRPSPEAPGAEKP